MSNVSRPEKMAYLQRVLGLGLFAFLLSTPKSHAFTYKGIAYANDGITPLNEKVNFTFAIYDPSRQCLLYQEKHLSVLLTNGAFSRTVGTSTPTSTLRDKPMDPGLLVATVFATSGVVRPPGSINCTPGYTAIPGNLLYMRVQIFRIANNETITLTPDVPLNPATKAIAPEPSPTPTPTPTSTSTPTSTPSPTPSTVPNPDTPSLPIPSTTASPVAYLTATGNVSQATLGVLTNGADASTLHHHDSIYVKLSNPTAQNLGAGGIYTAGSITIGSATPSSGAQLSVKSSTATTVTESIQANVAQSADLLQFLDPAGGVLAGVSPSGQVYVGSSYSSANELSTKGYVAAQISTQLNSYTPKIDITHGGTGATTQQGAINALTGTQSAGKYLRSDGTNAALSNIQTEDLPNLDAAKITTGTLASTRLPVMTGDSGLGGAKGAVPAPAAGDAAAGKFLRADGTWATPSNTGGGVGPSVTALTDSATITVDGGQANVFTITLGGNRSIANPTNLVNGQIYTFRFTQDATGGRNLTWGSNYRFMNTTAVYPDGTPNSMSAATFISDGTLLYHTGGYGLQGVHPCPSGYIPVPGSPTYGTSEFCVAKFEMKQSGSTAVSQYSGTPWTTITQPSAITACRANGVKYDLISNAEWQSLAQNIETVSINWSSGKIGVGSINRGHSDYSPATTLAASFNDSLGCSGTGQTCSNTVWDSQRRTHVLFNGQVIWDLAGNAWEWIKETNTTSFGTDAYWSQITSSSHTAVATIGSLTGAAKFLFGPAGTYTDLNSGEYGGLGDAEYFGSARGTILRGGSYSQAASGLFTTYLWYTTSMSYSNIGLRCVYHP